MSITPEDYIKDYWETNNTGMDNRIKTALGQVQSKKMDELSQAITRLQGQIIYSSQDIRDTIRTSVDNVIESNTKLAESSERQATAMKWLTGGFIFVGLIQAYIAYIK